MLHTIRAVEVAHDRELTLTWDDGTTSVVDFGPIIAQGGVFAPLADPDFFRQVAIDPSGRFIVWPGDLDFCADALRIAGATFAAR